MLPSRITHTFPLGNVSVQWIFSFCSSSEHFSVCTAVKLHLWTVRQIPKIQIAFNSSNSQLENCGSLINLSSKIPGCFCWTQSIEWEQNKSKNRVVMHHSLWESGNCSGKQNTKRVFIRSNLCSVSVPNYNFQNRVFSCVQSWYILTTPSEHQFTIYVATSRRSSPKLQKTWFYLRNEQVQIVSHESRTTVEC